MRYLLAIVGVLAALVLMAASAAMNWVFMSGQGKTPFEGQVLGAVSVAIDLMTALLPFFIAWAITARRWGFAVLGSAMFALFFTFCLLSALGFATGNRHAVAGGRDALSARLILAERELADIERRAAALPQHRAAPVIEEALGGIRQDRLWSSSRGCEDATASATREFCKRVFELRAELAAAVEGGRLSAGATELRREVSRLKDQGAGLDKDPQAGIIAYVSGLDLLHAQSALNVFIAVMLELAKSFGLYLATAHLGDRPRSERRSVSAEIVEEDRPLAEPVPRKARAVRELRPLRSIAVGDNGALRIVAESGASS